MLSVVIYHPFGLALILLCGKVTQLSLISRDFFSLFHSMAHLHLGSNENVSSRHAKLQLLLNSYGESTFSFLVCFSKFVVFLCNLEQGVWKGQARILSDKHMVYGESNFVDAALCYNTSPPKKTCNPEMSLSQGYILFAFAYKSPTMSHHLQCKTY